MSEQKIPSLVAQGEIKALAKLLSENMGDFEDLATKMIKETSQWIQTHYGEESASACLDEVIRGVVEIVENLMKQDPSRAPWLEQIAERFRRRLSEGIDYVDQFIRCSRH